MADRGLLYVVSTHYVQVVETEFADMMDPDVSAATAWRTQTTPAEIMRMRALESVEASISKPNIRESSVDAVRTGMASKTVSVRYLGIFL